MPAVTVGTDATVIMQRNVAKVSVWLHKDVVGDVSIKVYWDGGSTGDFTDECTLNNAENFGMAFEAGDKQTPLKKIEGWVTEGTAAVKYMIQKPF